jgi:uncharacterized protein
MGNAVVHFELGAADEQQLVRFYGELFGWGMQPIPGGYTLIDTRAGSGINGGIGQSRTGDPWVAFYVEADDLQTVLDSAETLGARTIVPVSEVPGIVTWAMFADPDGLLIGLVKGDGGGQGDQHPSQGEGAAVDWFEVLGSDAGNTQRFYTELFGWKIGDSGSPGYGLVDTGAGRGAGGGLGASDDGTKWATVYASVEDVQKTLVRAEELGGRRVYGPTAVDDHMQTGAFRDPAGNAFGIYHHPPH